MSNSFIVFEGPEGSGKSSQIALLAGELRARGFSVCVTREPGGTPIGEHIRELLLDRDGLSLSSVSEALLIAAARAQHVRDVIAPSLARGEIVLCDRFTDSTLAYQGAGRGLQADDLEALNRFATGGLEPELRILLDLPVEVGLSRRRHDGDSLNRLDSEAIDFHRRVRDFYLTLASQRPNEWAVIDSRRSQEAVAADVLEAALAHLSPGQRATVSP